MFYILNFLFSLEVIIESLHLVSMGTTLLSKILQNIPPYFASFIFKPLRVHHLTSITAEASSLSNFPTPKISKHIINTQRYESVLLILLTTC